MNKHQENITNYWEVQPPYKVDGEVKPGSIEFYNSIRKNRYEIIDYMHDYFDFTKYNGKSVLEIGCGSGIDLCEFASNGARVTGIDITEVAVSLAKSNLELNGYEGQVLKYDGQKLNFDDDSFDLVYSCGVLHHTPFMEDLLVEAHRVLKPGGRLMMMLYNKNSLLYYYSILYLRKYKENLTHLGREEVLSTYSEFRTGCPHTRCLTVTEIESMLWYFGKVDVTTDYCVYDTVTERKLKGNKVMEVEKTKIADIDTFFENFNRAIENGEDFKKFGWHLLIKADK